MACVQ
jgi:hypothetical protein